MFDARVSELHPRLRDLGSNYGVYIVGRALTIRSWSEYD